MDDIITLSKNIICSGMEEEWGGVGGVTEGEKGVESFSDKFDLSLSKL